MRTSLFLKRSFDLLIASAGIVVLSPLFIIIVLIIKFSDNGEIFFTQKRIGRGGVPFRLYKFRTMAQSVQASDGLFEPGNLSRITPAGKFLRRSKADELPQLFNVVKGDMSIVGPRPEVEKWVAVYPEKWKRILTVKPGITDIASIKFRDEEELLSQYNDPETAYRNLILPRKLELCLDYVDNHSFVDDLRILILTFKTILFK